MIVKYKDYYNGTVNVDIPDDTPPELMDEVMAFFKEDYRREYNMHRRDERHGLSSLDAFEYEPAASYDYSSLAYRMTPEEILLLKEENERSLQRLDILTETQRRRILLKMYGFSMREIAGIEGTDHTSVAESILTNEKYKGDAILQKTFTIDFLSKKMKPNEGEVPQYYVTDSHPAIIDRTEWQLVQEEMARRKARGSHHNSMRTFSSMIYCGDCGAQYGSKVWHSTDKYRRVIWQCNSKFRGDEKCRTPHLYEQDIQRLFLSAVSRFLSDRSALLEDCQLMHDALADTTGLDAEIGRLSEEMDTVTMLITRLINENASVAMSQEEYSKQYDAYAERFEKAQARYEKLQAEKQAAIAEADTIAQTMKEIASVQELPIEFEEHLWFALIDRVTAYRDERIVFRFKTGQEITEQL